MIQKDLPLNGKPGFGIVSKRPTCAQVPPRGCVVGLFGIN